MAMNFFRFGFLFFSVFSPRFDFVYKNGTSKEHFVATANMPCVLIVSFMGGGLMAKHITLK